MKTIVSIVYTICFLVSASSAQTLSTNLSFEERVHNFGTIKESDGKVMHTFVFRNIGTRTLAIDDIYSNCGCIGKAHSNKPVPAGGKGEITVTFDPSYKSGFFSKEIIILSNNSQNYNHVWVEGTIVPAEHPVEDDYPYNFGSGLHLNFKVMAFGYMKPGETKKMDLRYANATDKEIVLNFAVLGSKEGLHFINPGRVAPNARGLVNFSYTMPADCKKDAIFIVFPYVNNRKLTESIEVKILIDHK